MIIEQLALFDVPSSPPPENSQPAEPTGRSTKKSRQEKGKALEAEAKAWREKMRRQFLDTIQFGQTVKKRGYGQGMVCGYELLAGVPYVWVQFEKRSYPLLESVADLTVVSDRPKPKLPADVPPDDSLTAPCFKVGDTVFHKTGRLPGTGKIVNIGQEGTLRIHWDGRDLAFLPWTFSDLALVPDVSESSSRVPRCPSNDSLTPEHPNAAEEDSPDEPPPPCSLHQYYPRGEARGHNAYYRVSWRSPTGKVKHQHIRGGNIWKPAVRAKVEKIRDAIARRDPLEEILKLC